MSSIIYTVPGLIGWADPQNPAALTLDGVNIQATKDSISGASTANGFSLAPDNTTTNCPTLGLVGKCPQGMLFDGVNANLYGDAARLSALLGGTNKPFTIATVAYTTDITTYQSVVMLNKNSAGGGAIQIGYQDSTYVIARQDDTGLGGAQIPVGNPVNGQVDSLIFTFDGTDGLLYVNGDSVGGGDLSAAGTVTLENLSIGCRYDGSVSLNLSGGIGPVMVFNGVLDTNNIELVNNYLANQYGVAL